MLLFSSRPVWIATFSGSRGTRFVPMDRTLENLLSGNRMHRGSGWHYVFWDLPGKQKYGSHRVVIAEEVNDGRYPICSKVSYIVANISAEKDDDMVMMAVAI